MDVKAIWQASKKDEKNHLSEESIEKIIQQGSSNIIAKFIKTLNFEKRLNLVILSFLPLFCIYDGEYKIAFGAFVLDGLLYAYYDRLINQLKKERIDVNVLQYLKDVYKLIQRFILHLKVAIFPLSALAVGAAVYLFDVPFDLFVLNEDYTYLRVFVSITTMILSLCASFFVIHLMYGRKAIKINKMICSLDVQE